MVSLTVASGGDLMASVEAYRGPFVRAEFQVSIAAGAWVHIDGEQAYERKEPERFERLFRLYLKKMRGGNGVRSAGVPDGPSQ